jgi:ubiquinone/menaquinone biosynthesis C-methylase UbiE
MLDDNARRGAQDTWNSRACEEMEGDKSTLAYFDAVAAKRYADHNWMPAYFGYGDFATQKVLEVGIGQGTDLANFATKNAICSGVDIADNHLMLTARNFTLRGLDVDLRKSDATALPFENDTFDCVYSMGVVHHIPEIEQVLGEMHRVLKPGGLLMTAVYNKWSAFHICQKIMANGVRNGWLFSKGYKGLLSTIEAGADGITIKPYVRLYSKREFARLLSRFEIQDVSLHHLADSHFWPPFVQRTVRSRVSNLESRLGWYVCAKARAVK